MVETKASPKVESRASAPLRISWDPHGLPHTTNARWPHSAPPTECGERANQSWQANRGSTAHRSAALANSETPADAVDGGAMTMRGRSGGQPAWIRACLCWCRHPRSSPLPDRASGPTRPPAARRLSTFGSSMCRGRKPGEFDRIGVWRAGTYHISTVCHAACVGSSQKRRQIDRSDQHAYRGAGSELPMVPEARHGGHSRSVMVSVRPVLSSTIIV